jgi:2-haloacid dehalogenase
MTGYRIPPHIRDAWTERRRETLSHQVALAAGPPIGAVVFDAYGTLFDVQAVEAACATLARDPAAFVALWRARQLEYSWLRSLMGRYADFATVTAEALDHTLAHFRIHPGDEIVRDLLDAWLALEPFPDVRATLARLRDLPLAILSNGSPAMLAAVLAHSGLAGDFAAVLSVDAARAYKPDPRVYALAPAALNLPADQILFVSANAWDAVGAKAYGFRVAWCNRAGRTFDTHGPAPDLEVRSLEGVADALKR